MPITLRIPRRPIFHELLTAQIWCARIYVYKYVCAESVAPNNFFANRINSPNKFNGREKNSLAEPRLRGRHGSASNCGAMRRRTVVESGTAFAGPARPSTPPLYSVLCSELL